MRKFAHLSTAVAVGTLVVLAGCSTAQHVSPAAQTNVATGSELTTTASSARPAAPPATSDTPVAPPKPAAPAAPVANTARGTLNPVQLPGDTALSWRVQPAPQTHPVVQDVQLNECLTVHGATTWKQQIYRSAYDAPAGQDTFVFPTAAAADAAYRALLDGMNGCATHSRELQAAAKLPTDTAVTPTGQTATGAAWSRAWTGAGGISAPGSQTNHIYLVHHDAVVTALQITEFPTVTPTHAVDTTKDAAVLDALASNL